MCRMISNEHIGHTFKEPFASAHRQNEHWAKIYNPVYSVGLIIICFIIRNGLGENTVKL